MTPDPINRRLGVLISGGGSNLQALINATTRGQLDAEIVVVMSNVANAYGLQRARAAGIEALHIDHRGWPSREEYDRAVARELKARDVGLVCLAGYLRLVTAPMIEAFPNAILNIHPSLLPAFPGLHAQRQALAHGVKVTGATVHLVTRELDDGPIVVQHVVPVLDDDTPDTLVKRILAEEHKAYPEAVRVILNGGWRVEGRRFIRAGDPSMSQSPLPAGS